ncbi:MAG: GTP cyclohydrolase I FolE [Verrucomicrobiales bacterium]
MQTALCNAPDNFSDATNMEALREELEPCIQLFEDGTKSSGPDPAPEHLFDQAKFAALVKAQLKILGEDTNRDGLLKTPDRVARALSDLTCGYHQDPSKVVNNALFDVQTDEIVIVRNMELYSLCEHHLLPFFGKCHVGYLPKNKVIGLSKLPRLVDVFARRLQVQERLTMQIAQTVMNMTGATGVGVIIEAQHLCMQMRGVQKQGSTTLTSAMLGSFREDPRTRSEFLSLVLAK